MRKATAKTYWLFEIGAFCLELTIGMGKGGAGSDFGTGRT